MDRYQKRHEGPWFVYILESDDKRRTYVGATKRPNHRLRQHNGLISSGAKATRRGRPWKRAILVKNLPDSHYALCLEWAIKHNRCGSGIEGRCRSLRKILNKQYWTSTCKGDINIDIECYSHLEYYFKDITNVKTECVMEDLLVAFKNISVQDIPKPRRKRRSHKKKKLYFL
jgi:predicted GIY-YIG superfamily endonuclease